MKTCVIGASGYTGAELVRLIQHHPKFTLGQTFVSEQSADAGQPLSVLYPALNGIVNTQLEALNDATLASLAHDYDAIFLATPHQASHDWASQLLAGSAKVFDLSGAFRLQDRQVFERYYGFQHTQPHALGQAVYGLAEWYQELIAKAKFVAVPGCYPTASLLATKPLGHADLLDPNHFPIINATSGVSGAGRKATMTNSFCEVSLQAYGILGHRHTPEISAYLGSSVIFTPHLGNFKRGILATTVCKLKYGVSADQVEAAYLNAYSSQPMVRLVAQSPRLDNVVGQNFADLHWQYSQETGYVVITSAIDNLLKGAASQAVQCANLAFGLSTSTGLIGSQHG
ncbi:N-acetyl-gamma-glutamyl-phosphate reductase [Alteromonas sp. ASW11-36]|uniref:N-acetyl-gamma-glutamyl-phosphate reductase n=1 Tax=Alteromonas arenosi TaxID=3055817 RepID=A0ABT7SZI5_9ALTE|nr:N-acetyl-gamma-glutamyl-phosphate reductase [Alteromonas sp. ASW11-36]MDM7861611.1 N-acetyl-gamma-glutamyl-phosphate reductase [Alteromonas sp. ASW11-36]